MKKLLYLGGGLLGAVAGATAALTLRFRRNQQREWEEWARFRPARLDLGAVKSLAILPLIDWYTAREDLAGEPGVSYLVEADDTTILFDVGYNMRGEHPSPLLCNMQALGVNLEDVDCIVISHLHCDHVGGMGCQRRRTFALSGEPLNLSGMTAFVPEPMTHPTATIKVVEEPQAIAPGVATMGPIGRALFFLSWVEEQSLAVNVEGKGIVLVVGCGHQGVRRIVEQTEMLFDEPLHGLIGGLHLPVTASRESILGIPLQRLAGTGRPPWSPLRKSDVGEILAYLKGKGLQLIGLSAHDSCDWTLAAFREAFGPAYREVKVGERIVVA